MNQPTSAVLSRTIPHSCHAIIDPQLNSNLPTNCRTKESNPAQDPILQQHFLFLSTQLAMSQSAACQLWCRATESEAVPGISVSTSLPSSLSFSCDFLLSCCRVMTTNLRLWHSAAVLNRLWQLFCQSTQILPLPAMWTMIVLDRLPVSLTNIYNQRSIISNLNGS